MTMPATRVSVADTSDARGLAKGNGTLLGADSGAEGAVAAPQWGPPRVGGRGAWDTAARGTLGRQSGGVRGVLGRATVPCHVTVSRQWPAWSREPRAQALCSLTTWRPTGPPAAPPGPTAAAGPRVPPPLPLLSPRPRVLCVLHCPSGSRQSPHILRCAPSERGSWHAATAARSGGLSRSRPVHRAQSCPGTRPGTWPPRSVAVGATCSPGNPSPILLLRLGVRSPWGSGSEPGFKACTSAPAPPSLRPARLWEGWSPRPRGSSRWPGPPQ